jgi:hypothetical protein
MQVPTALLAALLAGTGAPTLRADQPLTPATYSLHVTEICAGARMFNGVHSIGTRAGAIAVARDIRATGGERLRRVDGIPKPPKTRRLVERWLAFEYRLVEMYASNYLRIWYAIERAYSSGERAKLPALLDALIHEPDTLQRRAARLEQRLNVPDCSGGQSTRTNAKNPSGPPS